MGEHQSTAETKLALIEQKLDLTLTKFDEQYRKLEAKLDKYNGFREKVDALVCWKSDVNKILGGVIVGIVLLVVGMVVKR